MDRQLPVGTVTFVFTDIEGSTGLLRRLGPRYDEVLERHARIVRQALTQHGGVEVGTEGDSFFAAFPSAPAAVAAVAGIQRRLAAERWPDDAAVRIRIGLHTGEGRLADGNDYVGLDVHFAARIAAAAHGGQVVVSDATRALVVSSLPVGVGFRDLGDHRLKDFDRPVALTQLVLDGLPADFPALRTLDPPTTLPGELTSFVGRRDELEQAARLLHGTRLLTLTGPGGTGKTRLAIRIAGLTSERFPDGIAFIALAPLTDSALVASTVALSLGLTDQPERPVVERLVDHLERRAMLLVLDNFEHLLPAADLVARLLDGASQVTILVTSRRRLGLYGEQEFPVPPLSLHSDTTETASSDAVALFLDRARAVRPDFELTPETTDLVEAICARLDGLPLAIELAASRVRILDLPELLERLAHRLTLLTSSASNVPPRQRTLRGAIESSYDLLDPAHRELFVRLAVFAGAWTLEAAEAVCNPGAELGIDTLDGVMALVDSSLIRRQAGGGSRFVMLETLREFGRERMTADGSLDAASERHLRHYRDLGEAITPRLTRSDQAAALDQVERDHDDVRAALAVAVETGRVEDGLRLATAVWRFWQQRGLLREGRSWLERLLAMEADATPVTRARAYGALGGLTYWLADIDATEQAYEAAVRIARDLGDRALEAQALYDRSFVAVLRGEPDAAREVLADGLVLARIQHSLGMNLAVGGDPAGGLALIEDALAHFRRVGDSFHLVWTLGELAETHRLLGDLAGARAATFESLRIAAAGRNLPAVGGGLEELAALESEAGQHGHAIRLLAAATALREAGGANPPALYLRIGDVEALAREAIGDTAVDAAAAQGRRDTLDESVAFALSLEDRVDQPAS